MNTDLHHYFEEKKKLIDEQLLALLPEPNHLHGTLTQAAAYALNAPGKRVRPILTLASAKMLGGSEEAALAPACAIELIHTYSMIHDDLPCMDDDDMRRGLPTLHRTYPEEIAVLTGDFLLTLAFQILADAPELLDSQKVSLIHTLSSAAGGEGMIAGQVMDLEAENQSITTDHLQLIHIKKTGFLLSSALEFGAIVANTSATYRQHLKRFGLIMGLAYQVIDDILDVTNSVVKHGKALSSDEENRKSTYVSCMGLDAAYKAAEGYVSEARNILKELPGNTSTLDQFATYTLERAS